MNRRVNFATVPQDFQAALLGALGFSTAYIQRRTRYSHGQIIYRLRKAAVKRTDYRNGTSAKANIVLSAAEREVARRLAKRMGVVPQRLRVVG